MISYSCILFCVYFCASLTWRGKILICWARYLTCHATEWVPEWLSHPRALPGPGPETGSIHVNSTVGQRSQCWTLEYRSFFLIFYGNSFFFNFYSIKIVCIFSPSFHPTPANPTSFPNLYPPSWFCPCVLYSSSSTLLSPPSPPPSPLAIVTLYLISMSLVIFCLLFSFVDYVPVKGEIIWYLSLTAWLISLSIMLCSSIHAVANSISSYLLPVHRIPLCKCTIVFWSTHLLMGT